MSVYIFHSDGEQAPEKVEQKFEANPETEGGQRGDDLEQHVEELKAGGDAIVVSETQLDESALNAVGDRVLRQLVYGSKPEDQQLDVNGSVDETGEGKLEKLDSQLEDKLASFLEGTELVTVEGTESKVVGQVLEEETDENGSVEQPIEDVSDSVTVKGELEVDFHSSETIDEPECSATELHPVQQTCLLETVKDQLKSVDHVEIGSNATVTEERRLVDTNVEEKLKSVDVVGDVCVTAAEDHQSVGNDNGSNYDDTTSDVNNKSICENTDDGPDETSTQHDDLSTPSVDVTIETNCENGDIESVPVDEAD